MPPAGLLLKAGQFHINLTVGLPTPNSKESFWTTSNHRFCGRGLFSNANISKAIATEKIMKMISILHVILFYLH